MTETQTTASKTTTEKATVICNCGCEEPTQSGKSLYRPGHDARHAGQVGRFLATSDDPEANNRVLASLGSESLRVKALAMDSRLRAKAQAKADREAKKNAPKVAPVWEADGKVKVGRWEYEAQKDQHGNRRRNTKTSGDGNWVAYEAK